MRYRARIVFNAPVDREHVVYSMTKPTAGEVHQMLVDLGPVLKHAVSVVAQRTDDPEARHGWRDISALAVWQEWDGPASEVLV